MNKVYFFTDISGDVGGVFVAEDNFKEAKKIALKAELLELMDLDNPFIEIRGNLCRKSWDNNKPIETEFKGELNIKQINDLGLSWWSCDECGDEEFEMLNDQEYKCIECGYIGEIPYVGL